MWILFMILLFMIPAMIWAISAAGEAQVNRVIWDDKHNCYRYDDDPFYVGDSND